MSENSIDIDMNNSLSEFSWGTVGTVLTTAAGAALSGFGGTWIDKLVSPLSTSLEEIQNRATVYVPITVGMLSFLMSTNVLASSASNNITPKKILNMLLNGTINTSVAIVTTTAIESYLGKNIGSDSSWGELFPKAATLTTAAFVGSNLLFASGLTLYKKCTPSNSGDYRNADGIGGPTNNPLNSTV